MLVIFNVFQYEHGVMLIKQQRSLYNVVLS